MYNKNEYIKQKQQSYYINKHTTKKVIRKYRMLGKESIIHRIMNSLASRANFTLKRVNVTRICTHAELVGCDLETLKVHIEQQFTEGMTFDNYGEWDIDHIIPIASFDFSIVSNIYICYNYKNLQPLWHEDNLKKGAKLSY